MKVLGIETSCDETGVAVFDTDAGLVAHRLFSQVDLHAAFGGVVPELASRDHVRRLPLLVGDVLDSTPGGAAALDGVAYTAGPGLVGALLVGAAFARSLAYGWDKPAVAVHHMEGHLLAPLLESPPPPFPFLALLVSGGHSMLVDVAGLGRYTVLGTTLDDAAGEAFDKAAKLLGLGYPGGPALAKLAANGRADAFDLPRPLTKRPGLDFSFSGLKTALAITVQKLGGNDALDAAVRADLAASFQEAIVATLTLKALAAADASGHTRLVVAGGVGANRPLRQRLAAAFKSRGGEVFYPRLEFCTDNGAMIALAGALRLTGADGGLDIRARPRWPLDELAPLAAG